MSSSLLIAGASHINSTSFFLSGRGLLASLRGFNWSLVSLLSNFESLEATEFDSEPPSSKNLLTLWIISLALNGLVM